MGRNGEPGQVVDLRLDRSRRRLLVGMAGALGLLGSEVAITARPALAANGNNVVLGDVNDATSATGITNIDGIASGLQVSSAANAGTGAFVAVNGGGTGAGVYATSQHGEGLYAQSGTTAGTSAGATRNGVHGVTDSAADSGVWGQAVAGGIGVSGSTQSAGIDGPAGVFGVNLASGPGVKGLNNSGGAAIYGKAASSEGLYAQSGLTPGTSPGSTRNGMHGVTDSTTDSAVWGEAVSGGFGVTGSTTSHGLEGAAGVLGNNLATGPGVLGVSQGGAGVIGVTSGGTGVLAENISGGGGHALRVIGSASFSRSGHATIASPRASATVIVPGGLVASGLVFALLQTSAPGLYVSAAVPDHSKGTVTIHLNKAPARRHPVKVAWFAVN